MKRPNLGGSSIQFWFPPAFTTGNIGSETLCSLSFLIPANFSKKKQYVGLDIGSSSLKAVALRPSGNHDYELVGYGFEDLSPGCIVEGAITTSAPIVNAINRIFANPHINSNEVVASISGHSVIVKKISIHLRGDDDLTESIYWEAEQHLPFDIAEVNLDFQILGENIATETLDVLLVAVKKDNVQSYTSLFNQAKKIPVILDVNAFALHNAYEFNYEPEHGSTAALLNIGAGNMMINLVSGTEFLFTRDISVGGQRYTEFLQKEFNLGYEEAQSLKHGEIIDNVSQADVQYVMDSVTEIICMEIQKTFDFFKSTSTVNHIDRMFISGGATHTSGLVDALGSNFDIPVEIFDSFRRIRVDSNQFPMIKEQAADMTIAVGLALRSDEA
jgi:type IV pilus assembly protein PilM